MSSQGNPHMNQQKFIHPGLTFRNSFVQVNTAEQMRLHARLLNEKTALGSPLPIPLQAFSSGIIRVNPLTTGVLTYLVDLSGMNHQVLIVAGPNLDIA